jgi:sulfotransferase family protein
MTAMPNFFVIGANRSGTTSLHEYLNQHPDVYMSPVKEPSYFAPKARRTHPLWPNRATPAESLDDYLALFAGSEGETAIGESSTAYLSSPQTPTLIRESVPEAKLVAVLRNPVDRAFSGYCLHRSWGTEDLSFPDAVSAELDHDDAVGGRRRGYVLLGFYGRYLTGYLEHFERDHLRVYLYEDLVADPDALLHDLFEYLDVDASFVPATATRHNAARYEPKHKVVDRVARARPVKAIARRLVSDGVWARAKDTVRRKNSVPPDFPADLRRRLVDVYRSDIELTQDIIGRDLSAWLA